MSFASALMLDRRLMGLHMQATVTASKPSWEDTVEEEGKDDGEGIKVNVLTSWGMDYDGYEIIVTGSFYAEDRLGKEEGVAGDYHKKCVDMMRTEGIVKGVKFVRGLDSDDELSE